jgi:hypothetical protein
MVSRIDNITDLPTITIPHLGVSYNESDLYKMIQEYWDTLAQKDNANRFNSPPSGLTIVDFLELVKNAVEHKQTFESIPSDRRLLFLTEDPPEEIDTEGITCELTTRRPGSFSRGPAAQGKIKEVTAHMRAMIDHPESPGEKLITMGRKHDNFITFYTYAKTNRSSLRRALWFEELMESYRWYFRIFGFNAIQEEISKKEIVNIGELKLRRYPIRYIVMTDDTFHVTSQELRDVTLKVTLSNG